MTRRVSRRMIPVAVWTAAVVLVVWPVVALVVGTLWDNDVGAPARWGLGAFARAVGLPKFTEALVTTVVFVVIVVPVSLALALLLAVIGEFSDARLRRLVGPTMVVSYAIPPLFYAVGYVLVGSGRAGAGNDLVHLFAPALTPFNLTSFPGLIFVSVLRATAFAYILLVGPVSTMGQSQDEAARVAGGGTLVRMRLVLATLRPSVVGAAVLVTIGNVQVFDAVYVLGGNAGVTTLSTLTFELLNQQNADFAAATAIGTLLLGLVLVLVVVQHLATRRGRFTTVTVKPEARLRLRLGRWRPVVSTFIVGYALVALAVPIACLVLTSVLPFPGVYSGLSLRNYAELGDSPVIVEAITTTVVLAVLGATAAVTFAMLMIRLRARTARAATRGLLDMMMLAPKVMYGIVTAIAFIWAVTLIPPARGLYGTVGLLFIALAVGAVPVSYLLLSGAHAQLDPTLEHAAHVSGAGVGTTQLRVLLPLLAPSLINAWFLAAVLIAGALDVPLILGSVQVRVVASTVFELYSLNADYGGAAALLVSMLVIFAFLAVLLRGFVLLLRADLRPWRATVPAPVPLGGVAVSECASEPVSQGELARESMSHGDREEAL